MEKNLNPDKEKSGWNRTRERMKEAGYYRLEIWVKKDRAQKVKEVIKRINQADKITD